MNTINEENELILNIRFVKGSKPILIGDEENKDKQYDSYPPGYHKVFESIYPPEEWTEGGKTWRRVASTEPADGNQTLALSDELKYNISHWHARMDGVCPIRRELFTQCFNELIRQVCVNSIGRGELLIKIRNEYTAIIITYRHLFESGLLFRVKHSKLDDNITNDIAEMDIRDKEEKNVLLKKKLMDENIKYDKLRIHVKKELNNLKDSNQHELNFVTGHQKVLKEYLQLVLSMNTT